MNTQEIDQIAKALHEARTQTAPVEQWSDQIKEFTQAEAYAIQEKGMTFRQEDGEKLIGLKMGLTSKAKREQMNLDSPLYGQLTDHMEVPNKGVFHMKGKIHPKIEPEVAFYIEKELKGPNVSREEILDATGWVCACMEILDSRYKQFKYFSLEDVISDNSSSCMFVLGEKITDFKNIDLTQLKMEMSVNGEVAKTGMSHAISGDPVVSVQQLCELLCLRGQSLPAHQVVLAGAATEAIMLEEGMSVSLNVENLGTVAVQVEN